MFFRHSKNFRSLDFKVTPKTDKMCYGKLNVFILLVSFQVSSFESK